MTCARKRGLERDLRPRAPSSDVVDLAGNDYLGLSRDPRVVEAAAAAARHVGRRRRRIAAGHRHARAAHRARAALAAFTGHPAALVFSTGYHANLAVVTALTDPDTLIVSDAHVHASLVDACRLASPVRLVIVGPQRRRRGRAGPARPHPSRARLVLVESVYSVLGDAAPLAELAAIAETYDAVLVVDEAHALGVAGKDGARAGREPRPRRSSRRGDDDDAVQESRAAKAARCSARPDVIDHLVNTARPFIYDTGLAPAAAGAALAALAHRAPRTRPAAPRSVGSPSTRGRRTPTRPSRRGALRADAGAARGAGRAADAARPRTSRSAASVLPRCRTGAAGCASQPGPTSPTADLDLACRLLTEVANRRDALRRRDRHRHRGRQDGRPPLPWPARRRLVGRGSASSSPTRPA